jgi:hypothetical protein
MSAPKKICHDGRFYVFPYPIVLVTIEDHVALTP